MTTQPYAPILNEDGSPCLWTTGNVAEAMPGLHTPLSWTMWKSSFPWGQKAFHELGVLTPEERDSWEEPRNRTTAIFYGRVAMNIDYLRRSMNRMPGASANGFELSMAGIVRPGVVDEPDEETRAVVATRLGDLQSGLPQRMQAFAAEAFAAWRQAIADAAAGVPWRQILADGCLTFQRGLYMQTMVSVLAQNAYYGLAVLAAEHGHPGLDSQLVTGYGTYIEQQMLESLWGVSRGEVSLGEFIDRYGYNGPNCGAVESVSWRENPAAVAAQAEQYKALSDEHSPATMAARQVSHRQEAERLLLDGQPPETEAVLRSMIAVVTSMMPMRELGKSAFVQGIDIVRLASRLAGQDFVAKGVVSDPSDVNFLTTDELLGAEDILKEIDVASRRAEYDSYRELDIPAVFQDQPEPIRVAAYVANDGTTVSGVGVSPGVAEGRARVVHSSDESLIELDEVLVASVTDPSWAPFCVSASAMVIDIGGALSHAAIVARELGVPCVINTVDGTKRIRTGDLVRVDGGAGTVEILERAATIQSGT